MSPASPRSIQMHPWLRIARAMVVDAAAIAGITLAGFAASLVVLYLAGVSLLPHATGGEFVLRDGRVLEADTPEDVAAIQSSQRGNIQSVRTRLAYTTALTTTLTTVALAAPFAALLLYTWFRNRSLLRAWLRPSVSSLALGAAVGSALLLSGQLYVLALRALDLPVPDLLGALKLQVSLPWLVLLIGVVAPLAEEAYFRGHLFRGVSEHAGDRAAVLVSASLFALAHGLPILLPCYLAFGLLLGWTRRVSGGLIAPIAAHALNNLTAFLL
jgi:membrane protease YdiL (CAAX protease family)